MRGQESSQPASLRQVTGSRAWGLVHPVHSASLLAAPTGACSAKESQGREDKTGGHSRPQHLKARFVMLSSPQCGLEMEPSGGRGDRVPVCPAYSHCFSSCSLPRPHLLVDSIKKQCFYAINLLRAVCRQFWLRTRWALVSLCLLLPVTWGFPGMETSWYCKIRS